MVIVSFALWIRPEKDWRQGMSTDMILLLGNTVDFDSFQKVLNRPGGFRDPGEPEEYCRGFQVFDKDMTGYIGVGQLRYSESIRSEEQDKRFSGLTGFYSLDEPGRENE